MAETFPKCIEKTSLQLASADNKPADKAYPAVKEAIKEKGFDIFEQIKTAITCRVVNFNA